MTDGRVANPAGAGARRFAHALLVAATLLSAATSSAQEPLAEPLKQRVEQLRASGSLVTSGEALRRRVELAELYEARGFSPAWSDPALAADLLRAIRGVVLDGLEPGDYHLARLEQAAAPAATAVELELLRSDALLGLVHDLSRGRVSGAARGMASISTASPPVGAAALAAGILASRRIAEGVAALRPRHFAYRGLMSALAELRAVQARGGWERIADGPLLHLGEADPRVPALRRRLAPGDSRAGSNPESTVLDDALDAALKRFQHRHALNEDGILGPATLAELNVPVQRRIDQVRVNLERARWLADDLPDSFVAVNIAGAMVYLVRGGEAVFEARAVVGKTYTRSPIFSAPMRYIDLNPTWTVPPGIVREVLADVRRDPDYLRRLDMRVLDRSGRRVNVSVNELGRYTAAGFPYVFRQEPGPLNPLGQVKFVFPNPYNVYLHDTPSKRLFEREQRTFSHGCIRVQDPLRLAELILDDPAHWSREALVAAIATGETRTIPLTVPLPVLVLYWTASTDLHGELHFYRDVYDRDAAVLRALGRG